MSLYVNIQKKLGDVTLEVKFETDEGTLGILGASGVGKSMTLKCIAGIECPDSGQIIYNNRILFDSNQGINVPVRERNIGYLFQSYALFPHMTVEENIKCGLSQIENGNERLVTLLESFQITDIRKLYPKQLSGGQKQRVALARMMSVNPEIILLDEPFSALDHQLKRTLQEELENLLAPFRKTVLLVSHDLREIERMCEWTMLIHKGKNTQPRLTKEVINAPHTLQEAQIVNGRNIVKVIKETPSTLYITEWNYTLTIPYNEEVYTHIAIDPHHMGLTKKGQIGSFKATGIHLKEKPFSYEIRTCTPEVQLEVDKATWEKYGDTKEIYITFESQDMMLINE